VEVKGFFMPIQGYFRQFLNLLVLKLEMELHMIQYLTLLSVYGRNKCVINFIS